MYGLSIHEMALYWGFLGPYSSRYGRIMLNFSPEVFSNNRKTVVSEFFKSYYFSWNVMYQSLHFWSKLGLMLPPRKPNTLLKIKFSAKANVLNFICYITSFSFWLFVALDFTIKKPSIKRSQLRLAPLFQKPSLRASCWWKKFCCSSFQTLVSFFTLSDSLCWL